MKSFHSLVPSLIFFFFTWVYGTTLLLSIGNILTPTGVRMSFFLFLIFIVIWVKKGKIHISFPRGWFVYVVLLILTLTFVQGYISAPNTTDAMVYHLPRVIFWIQHQSVFQSIQYTAHDYMPAFAEYIVAFFTLLTGSDRLAFLPQWLSFFGVICLSYLVPRELGATSSHARWISIFTFSLPILLLEATSTQTDLVMSFLLFFSLYKAVRYKKTADWKDLVVTVCALSFAVITKQIALFISLPILMSLFHTKLFTWKNVQTILFCSVLGIGIVGSYIMQSYVLYGASLGPKKSDPSAPHFFNEMYSPGVMISNVFRNLALQLPLPGVAPMVERSLLTLGNKVHIDLNDPRTTWVGATFHVPSFPIPQEDIAPSPLQVLLVCTGILLAIRKGNRYQKTLVLSSVLAFLLFSLVFKWQPYNNRLEMGFLLILLPVVLVVLWKYCPTLGKGVALISLLAGIVVILANTSRPFISYEPLKQLVAPYLPLGSQIPQSIFTKPRGEQYYIARSYWRSPYKSIADILVHKNQRNVSFTSFDGFTYPMLMELTKRNITISLNPQDAHLYTVANTENMSKSDICFQTEFPYGSVCMEDAK